MTDRSIFMGLAGLVVRGLHQKAEICQETLAQIDNVSDPNGDLRGLRDPVEEALGAYTSASTFIDSGAATPLARRGRLDPRAAMAHGRDLDAAERTLSLAQYRIERRLSGGKAHAA
jgi:hypothetical protein